MRNSYNILIGTTDVPRNNLGGPGKFAPYLFKILKLNFGKEFNFWGYFNGKFVSNYDDIIFMDKYLVKNKAKYKDFLKKYMVYLPYFSYIYKLKFKIHNYLLIKKIKDELKQKKLNFDILHLHCFNSVYLFKDMNTKIIFTNHYKGSLYQEYIRYLPGMNKKQYEKLFKSIEISAIKRADIITFPSKSAMNLLIEDYPNLKKEIEEKAHIIYSGIPDIYSLYIGNNKIISNDINDIKIILNISNHIPDKNIELSILLFRELLKYDKKIKFVNVGAFGPETQKLKSLAKDLGIEDKIEFKGIIPYDDLIKLIASSYIVLHTPKRVVFDLSVLEVMSFGKPLIITNVLGNREAVGDDYPLLIDLDVSVNDIMKSKKKYIESLFNNIEFRRNLSLYLRKRFLQNFTDLKMAESYYLLYEQMLRKKV